MKLAYFHLLTADNDDVMLGEAKVMGYVPETCLLGGVQVWKLIKAETDPCMSCNGPREKCKGRPLNDIPDSISAMFKEARAGGLSAFTARRRGD